MEVRGLKLEVTKEVISRVTTLPIEVKVGLTKKINDLSLKEDLLQGDE